MRAKPATQQPQSAAGGSPSHSRAEQAALSGLIDSGQYDEAAVILQQLQDAAEASQEVVLAQVLAVAQQVCLTCQQQMVEVEAHRRAFEDAVGRRREMQRQLTALVSAARQESAPLTHVATSPFDEITESGRQSPEPGPEAEDRPGLWQRIRAFFTDVSSEEEAVFGGAPPGTVDEQTLPSRAESPGEAADGILTPCVEVRSEDLTDAPLPSEMREESRAVIEAPFQDEYAPAREPPDETAALTAQPPGTGQESATSAAGDCSPQAMAEETGAGPMHEIPGEEVTPWLIVYCFGNFRVYLNDQPIEGWNGHIGQHIFKYLIANRRQPVAKDILMNVFWTDIEPEAARRNLHQAIYTLRKALRRTEPEFQHLVFENECYLLNPLLRTWIDYEEFERHIQLGQRLEAKGQGTLAMNEYSISESLYEGDFMADDLYHEWIWAPREQFRHAYLEIADKLSAFYIRARQYTSALILCQKMLLQDGCHETAHRRIMRCYASQGQRHLAIRRYEICRKVLEKELDLELSEKTVALYKQIKG